jgi:hypothetical protein
MEDWRVLRSDGVSVVHKTKKEGRSRESGREGRRRDRD